MRPVPSALIRTAIAVALLSPFGLAPAVQAQQAKTTRPPDKPPIAQGWIDLATFASPGMPGGMAGMMMGGGGGGMSGGSALGAMMGKGQAQQNVFGQTKGAGNGRYVDVAVRTSRNPTLPAATQAVPDRTGLAPNLQLHVLPQAKPVPEEPGETVQAAPEQPKGKIKLYWGCGATVRPGQPKVADLSTGSMAQFGEIMKGRRATQRGAEAAPGRPVWPNPQDARMVPASASFAGEHTFTGEGIPASFKFTIPAAQDLMAPINLQQTQVDGVWQLTWASVPNARAYFIAAMSGRDAGGETMEMILWTSSELPDSGFGLVDYQTNKSVDQWLGEKVLLPATATRCDVPTGIFGEGENAMAMLRMIAYGTELNLAYPPRPADTTVAYEPEWALKLRTKSVAMSMLGMPSMTGGAEGAPDASGAVPEDGSAAPADEQQGKKKKKFGLKDAMDAVKGAVPIP